MSFNNLAILLKITLNVDCHNMMSCMATLHLKPLDPSEWWIVRPSTKVGAHLWVTWLQLPVPIDSLNSLLSNLRSRLSGCLSLVDFLTEIHF